MPKQQDMEFNMIKQADIQNAYLLGRQAAMEKLAGVPIPLPMPKRKVAPKNDKDDYSLEFDQNRRASERAAPYYNHVPYRGRATDAEARSKYRLTQNEHDALKGKMQEESAKSKFITQNHFRTPAGL
jgi:hypothetical protein